jgi:hypothetical protein
MSVFQLAACHRDPTERPRGVTNHPNITLKDGRVLTEVDLGVSESNTLFLNYRTLVPIAACAEIEAEVREVWELVLRSQAEKRQVRRASIVPEDPTNLARGFSYVPDKDGKYVESNFSGCVPRATPGK